MTDIKKIMNYLANIWGNYTYFNWCKDYIKTIIVKQNEKKKIEEAIRCFLPELYAHGYSNVYIYNTNKNTLLDKTKKDINSFLDTFDCKIKEFNVYLAVSKDILPFKEILINNLNLEFNDDGCFKTFKRFDETEFVIIKINKVIAVDPNTAMVNAKKILNMFTLFYVAVDNKSKFEIFKTAMDKFDNQTFFPTDIDKGFRKIEQYSDLEAGTVAENTLNKLMETCRYNSETLFSFMNVLKKHNSAILDENIENSFLNLWSVFEMITKNIDAGSKIEKIRNITLMILTNNYFKRIIYDLDKNLKNILGKDKYNRILGKANIENQNNYYILACIIFLESHSSLRTEIFSLLRNHSNIRSRISQLNDLGGNVKHLFTMINRYKDRVGWHITRMYRYRNCIVHSGETNNDIEYICEHLHLYIDILINEFIRCLTCDMNLKNIDDVIIYNKLYSQELEKILNKDVEINEDIISLC